MTQDMPMCEVCGKRKSVAVLCVPGLPISSAYCAVCYSANAHPWVWMTGMAAMCDGYDNVNVEGQLMIDATIKHLGKTRAEFDKEVAGAMERIANYVPDNLPTEEDEL